MTTDLHDDLVAWLAAATRGRLSAEQKAELAEHLVGCPLCIRRFEQIAADPEAAAVLPLHAAGPELEERTLAALRAAVKAESAERDRLLPLPVRVRAGFAGVAGLLLLLRSLDVPLLGILAGLGLSWSVVWRVFLHQPAYPRPLPAAAEALSQQGELVAALHRLTGLYVEMLLWVGVATVVGLAALHVYRHRAGLRRCRQT